MEAMTLIEIEVNGKRFESIRDISIPSVGDFLHFKTVAAAFIVRSRHWIIDKNQSHRDRELRCILECEECK